MEKIFLPYGNNSFDIEELVAFTKKLPESYIIQGHAKCSFANHKKPKSLDYWLRNNFARNKDTMQAVSQVVNEIVKTGLFESGGFPCPETGKICKGLKLKNT